MRQFFTALACIALTCSVSSQPLFDTTGTAQKLVWFSDAKLGIFIHWGIYSVYGIDESWAFYNEKIEWEPYMKQLDGFTGSDYKPDQWAALFKEAGAKYAVLTSKHHDGVALWPTAEHTYNVVENTPAGRDLIQPFAESMRKQGLKVGMYYSLIDWSHPDYPAWTKSKSRYKISEDSARWLKFRGFCHRQIDEVMKRYHPDLVWFDGDWEHSAEEWQSATIRTNILRKHPYTIINSRLQGYGDYGTPEQFVPIHSPSDKPWELCMTMNDQWGYQPRDTNYKTPNQVIRIFADVIGKGGNVLLDIGPKPDGSIPAEQVNILKQLGRWTNKHAEAIYSTKAGMPPGYFYGPSTISADSTTLYLMVTEKPNGPVNLKGLKNKVNRITVVGEGNVLTAKVMMKPSWSPHAGILYIDVPDRVLDADITVLKLELDGPINLEH